MRYARPILLLLLAALMGAATTVAVALWCLGAPRALRRASTVQPKYASMHLETARVEWSASESVAFGLQRRRTSAAVNRGSFTGAAGLPERWEEIYDGDIRGTDTFIAQVHSGERAIRDRYREAIWRTPDTAAPHTAAALRETPIGRDITRGGWGRIPDPPAQPPDFSSRPLPITCEAVAAGWPLPAVWGWETTTSQFNSATGALTLVTLQESGLFAPPRTLAPPPARFPYLPVWPGFLLNSLLYAAPWALVLVAPRAVRRWRRRRRGCCMRCGYDLRGLGGAACPECGRAT
jgi:hypothetical protein